MASAAPWSSGFMCDVSPGQRALSSLSSRSCFATLWRRACVNQPVSKAPRNLICAPRRHLLGRRLLGGDAVGLLRLRGFFFRLLQRRCRFFLPLQRELQEEDKRRAAEAAETQRQLETAKAPGLAAAAAVEPEPDAPPAASLPDVPAWPEPTAMEEAEPVPEPAAAAPEPTAMDTEPVDEPVGEQP